MLAMKKMIGALEGELSTGYEQE